MGTKHKILEDFYDEWFMLIALHSNLEDHTLAYVLNSTLKTRFERCRRDIDIAENLSFSMFEWFDERADCNWFLFPNGTMDNGAISTTGLFKDMPSSAKNHLVPEHREVDYFIKIDQEVSNAVVKQIQEIPTVVTAYTVDCEKIKSKNNLIF